MRTKTVARTVTIDPTLAVLACIGLALAVVTMCLSSPMSGPSVQELSVPR